MAGALALIGGDEFKPGNEEQDRYLLERRKPGPAYVLATANSKHPDACADFAIRWFASLGAEVEELKVRSAADAAAPAVVEQAKAGGFFYLAGGNPRRVADILRGSAVWTAIHKAWQGGAALAGSSAGAMALGRWTLDPTSQQPYEALDLLPDAAVLPHYSQYGQGWIPAARRALGPQAWLLGLDERTALVHDGQAWRVMGPGEVHVLQGDRDAVFRRPDKPRLRIQLNLLEL